MEAESYKIEIYIAGDLQTIRETCRKFCLSGLCVSVTPTEYVFTGGAESGACVGLINYARFPTPIEEINQTAESLAIQLMTDCCQRSCSILRSDKSIFLQNEGITVQR